MLTANSSISYKCLSHLIATTTQRTHKTINKLLLQLMSSISQIIGKTILNFVLSQKEKALSQKQVKPTVLFNTKQEYSPSDYGKTPVQEATERLIHTNPVNSLVG